MTLSRPLTYIMVAIAFIAAIILIYLYATFDPAASGSLFPRCTFKMLTGLDCPGCGSQRAVHALLHGNFMEALRLNALFVVEIPLLLALGLVALIPNRFHRLRHFLVSKYFILSLLSTIVLFTIIRNIVNFYQ